MFELTKEQERYVNSNLAGLEKDNFSKLFKDCLFAQDFVAVYLFFRDVLKANVVLTHAEIIKYKDQLNAIDCICALCSEFPEMKIKNNGVSFLCSAQLENRIHIQCTVQSVIKDKPITDTSTYISTRVNFDDWLFAEKVCEYLKKKVNPNKIIVYRLVKSIYIETNVTECYLSNLLVDELITEVRETLYKMNKLIKEAEEIKERGTI